MLLSSEKTVSKFAFKCNLYRYSEAQELAAAAAAAAATAGGGPSVEKAVEAAARQQVQQRRQQQQQMDKKEGKKKPFGRNPGRWFTKRLGEAKAYLGGDEGDSPTSSSSGPGYSENQDDPAMRAIRAAAAAAGVAPPPDSTAKLPKRGDQHGVGRVGTFRVGTHLRLAHSFHVIL